MSREIVPEVVKREPWMTDTVQDELKQCADNGKISCARAHRFAGDHSIELRKMKQLMDASGIKLKECQLGCF